MTTLKTKVASSLTSLLTRLAKQTATTAEGEETKKETDDPNKESHDVETVAIGTECKNNGCEEVSMYMCVHVLNSVCVQFNNWGKSLPTCIDSTLAFLESVCHGLVGFGSDNPYQ